MAPCGVKVPRFLGPNVYPQAPDGGWGWVVAAAFFLVEAFTYGVIKSFGIFLQNLMEEFGETNSRVSWIVSICVFVMTFNGPLSSVMTNRFGFQFVVMLGGLLISTGTIATSFTSSVNQMYFTYGIVAGIGYSLTFLPTVTILSQYFSSRRSLVTAAASTGESLSIFALAPAFSALRDRVGWRHTMAVMGGLQSIIIICGALLRPIVIEPSLAQTAEVDKASAEEPEATETQPEAKGAGPEEGATNEDSCEPQVAYCPENELTTGSVCTGDSGIQSLKEPDCSSPEERALLSKGEAETAPESTPPEAGGKPSSEDVVESETHRPGDEKRPAKRAKLLDFSILRKCTFILYSLFGLFATLGFFAPQLYIIELSVGRGVERDHAAYMLSIMAVAEIFGRFSVGWVMTRKPLRKRKLLVMLACVVVMTADLVGFTLVAEFYGLAVCSSVYGFFMGTVACTHIPMLAEDDVVGIDRMSSAAGVYVFIHSFAGLAGPPIGGVLVDLTQNYGSAFYSCAAGMAISAVFLGLVKPAKERGLCKKRRSERPEEAREVRRPGDKVEQRTNGVKNGAAPAGDHHRDTLRVEEVVIESPPFECDGEK